MKYLSHNLTNDSQWQDYKRLELIPNSTQNPYNTSPSYLFGFAVAWRKLISLLMDELIEEQQVEYLERCWSLKKFAEQEEFPTKSLQRFWMLIN
ncbi:MAG: hypothetical protein HC820_03690 [Hydrococcus sp. RM1_1_31]|nr:hypothetical protein [Hydrococcus sp. RM1_1_31]